MLPVVFRPEAAVDAIEARKWYDDQQAGLGDDFRDRLSNASRQCLACISLLSEAFTVQRSEGFRTCFTIECWKIGSRYLRFFTAVVTRDFGVSVLDRIS